MKEKILALLQERDGFLSGQELGERLGVSRTSIWKAMGQLEELGYEIEAVRNKGYRLLSEPDFLTAEGIGRLLSTSFAGKDIRLLPSVDSTNSEVRRLAEDGAPEGLLVISQEQTAGRGRRGSAWESKKGDGIFMSLLLKPDIAPGAASMLTLVMGMAVRDALEDFGVDKAQIKWPNDIVCGGKKVCGILTEMSAQVDYINHIVIGVGINVHGEAFPKELKNKATSVFLETGLRIKREALVARCMERFEEHYAVFLKTCDLRGLKESYNRRLINVGRIVRVLDGKTEFTGKARGITETGELLVETESGLREVIAGEVSVRGVYGYV